MATQQQGTSGPQVRQDSEPQPSRQREQAAVRQSGTSRQQTGASQQQAGSDGGSRQMGNPQITDWASI
jgi:hypothetical protein